MPQVDAGTAPLDGKLSRDLPAASLSTLRCARVAFTGRLASLTHAEAREVVRRAGGEVVEAVSRRLSALVIGMLGWPLLPDGALSAKLRRVEAIRREGRALRVITEVEFLEIAGLRERTPLVRKTLPPEEIRAMLGVGREELRRWEQLALVRPGLDGRFDFQDLVSLGVLADLTRRGVRAETIARSLRDLTQFMPGAERPLAQLRIVLAQPGALLANIDDRLLGAGGQLWLNFEESAAAAVAGARAREPHKLTDRGADDAEFLFRRAQTHEEEHCYEAALRDYEAALRQRPDWPAALFNCGNVQRELGDISAAAASFRAALLLDPAFVEAWYNLADAQEQCEDLPGALASLRRALLLAPDYADAHYNAALLYERMELPADAARHWRSYLQHDPASEWADLARGRLQGPTKRA